MKSVPYEETEVPVHRSRARVEHLLDRFGAESTAVFRHSNGVAKIAFSLRKTPFILEVDPSAWERIYLQVHPNSRLTPERLRDKATRACWRHLETRLKARLEEVMMGLDPREVFVADIMVADGRRLGKKIIEEIETGGQLGTIPLLTAPETS